MLFVFGILALVSGSATALAPLVQARKMAQTRSSTDVSLITFGILGGNFAVWLGYGLALGNTVMIITNSIAVITMGLTIFVAMRYR